MLYLLAKPVVRIGDYEHITLIEAISKPPQTLNRVCRFLWPKSETHDKVVTNSFMDRR